MAGEQQRHHLIAYLPVAERAAVLVVRVQQQAEHVLSARPRRAAAVDLGVDDPVELLRRALQAGVRRQWAAQEARGVFGGVERQRALEQTRRVRAPRGLAVGVEPEQRAHRHPHRQPPRPAVQVHAAFRRQLLQRAFGLLAHHVDRRRDPLAVECRQHDLARAAVEVPVDRQQPVAQQPDQVAEVRLAPDEVLRVRHRHVVVGRRPQHEHDVAVQHFEREHRPVLLVALQQQRQRIVGEASCARHAEAGVAGWVGHPARAFFAQVVHHHRERVERLRGRRADEGHSRSLPHSWLLGQFGGSDVRGAGRPPPPARLGILCSARRAAGGSPRVPLRGGVAQLVRAPACHAGGRGFESRRSRTLPPRRQRALGAGP